MSSSAKSVRFFPSLTGSASDTGFLSKIKNMATSMSWKTMLIVVCAIILIIIAYSYFKQQMAPTFRPSDKEGFDSKKESEIMMFSTDWCPHCKASKPEWEQVKAEYNGKAINGYKILFTDVNCTTETPDTEKLMTQYKVEGFPTIILLKDGQIISFDAKPTKDNITKFLNTVL
jgi:thiol-disulfide isomerase/thioredoxin